METGWIGSGRTTSPDICWTPRHTALFWILTTIVRGRKTTGKTQLTIIHLTIRIQNLRPIPAIPIPNGHKRRFMGDSGTSKSHKWFLGHKRRGRRPRSLPRIIPRIRTYARVPIAPRPPAS
eukprot:scaffold22627_cov210-Cylindrotheca_fusiformis.AAC.1